MNASTDSRTSRVGGAPKYASDKSAKSASMAVPSSYRCEPFAILGNVHQCPSVYIVVDARQSLPQYRATKKGRPEDRPKLPVYATFEGSAGSGGARAPTFRSGSGHTHLQTLTCPRRWSDAVSSWYSLRRDWARRPQDAPCAPRRSGLGGNGWSELTNCSHTERRRIAAVRQAAFSDFTRFRAIRVPFGTKCGQLVMLDCAANTHTTGWTSGP